MLTPELDELCSLLDNCNRQYVRTNTDMFNQVEINISGVQWRAIDMGKGIVISTHDMCAEEALCVLIPSPTLEEQRLSAECLELEKENKRLGNTIEEYATTLDCYVEELHKSQLMIDALREGTHRLIGRLKKEESQTYEENQ